MNRKTKSLSDQVCTLVQRISDDSWKLSKLLYDIKYQSLYVKEGFEYWKHFVKHVAEQSGGTEFKSCRTFDRYVLCWRQWIEVCHFDPEELDHSVSFLGALAQAGLAECREQAMMTLVKLKEFEESGRFSTHKFIALMREKETSRPTLVDIAKDNVTYLQETLRRQCAQLERWQKHLSTYCKNQPARPPKKLEKVMLEMSEERLSIRRILPDVLE